jgi:hypothetical protein
MKGLCHFCFSSNVDLSIYRGKVWCDECKERDLPWPRVKERTDIMKPTDAAIETLPERTKHINQIMADLDEKHFAEYMDRERLSEPLIDRIHDT